MKTLWQKQAVDDSSRAWFYRFTAAEDRYYDQFLIPYDILGNIAQAKMLQKMGILTAADEHALIRALRGYYTVWQQGQFALTEDDEDIHSAVEKRLTVDCGDAGKRIHAGRSRNDQVMTDIRMYLKSAILDILGALDAVYAQLSRIRTTQQGVYFAGMTHTQPAMPTSVDAWALGFQDLLIADMQQLQLCYEQLDRLPLGSAAGYGAPYFQTERVLVAAWLGFSQIQHAMTAVQLGRGVLEKRLTDALGYTALTFNRMASDIILFAHPAFGFVRLRDDQTSGSSIMPQKRNPDAWELIRGNYSVFAGFSAQLGSLSAGLISGYHRDLQLTKKTVIDAIHTMQALSEATTNALDGLSFDVDRCRDSLTAEVFATHQANRLVVGGMSFREAYVQAAAQVQQAEKLSDADLNASYRTPGSPGLPHAAPYDHAHRSLTDWAGQQRQNQIDYTYKLLHDSTE